MIPAYLLPCIDDWDRLRVIADWFEENGHPELGAQCRWTANEWQGNRGLRRKDVEEDMVVYARYSSQGWTRAVVESVTPKNIRVSFPHRRPSFMSGDHQQGLRAWWDIEPRGWWRNSHFARPKKRNGYGTGKNAVLAAMLCGKPVTPKDLAQPIGEQSQPQLPFLEGTDA